MKYTTDWERIPLTIEDLEAGPDPETLAKIRSWLNLKPLYVLLTEKEKAAISSGPTEDMKLAS